MRLEFVAPLCSAFLWNLEIFEQHPTITLIAFRLSQGTDFELGDGMNLPIRRSDNWTSDVFCVEHEPAGHAHVEFFIAEKVQLIKVPACFAETRRDFRRHSCGFNGTPN